jgi:hypothetical protein
MLVALPKQCQRAPFRAASCSQGASHKVLRTQRVSAQSFPDRLNFRDYSCRTTLRRELCT